MESFLQKYVWIIHLALIAVAAILLGLAANRYVASHLAPYTVPQLPEFAKKEKKPTRRAPVAAQKNYARAVTERCLFGCSREAPEPECEGGCAEDEICQDGTCVPREKPGREQSGIPVPSDLNMKLLGAMVASNPDFSSALLSDPGTKQTFIVGVGDYVVENARVVEVRRDRVIFERNGRLEFIKLENSLQGNPSLTTSRPPPMVRSPVAPRGSGEKVGDKKSKRPVRTKAEDRKEGVKKVSENVYELDRASIKGQLENAKELAKQARIVPNFKRGKKHGIKLVGIAPGSVYSKIGIESGDVVVGINGKRVTGQNQALELLDQLRNKNEVSIEVERRGQKRKLKYSIK